MGDDLERPRAASLRPLKELEWTESCSNWIGFEQGSPLPCTLLLDTMQRT